jgi:hypothetical protein
MWIHELFAGLKLYRQCGVCEFNKYTNLVWIIYDNLPSLDTLPYLAGSDLINW